MYCLLFKVIISNDHFVGIVLILAGQCVSATQMIVEELFLKKKNFHPLQVSSLLDKKIKMLSFIDDLHYSLLLGFQPNLIMMPTICCRAMGSIFLSLYLPLKVDTKYPRYSRRMKQKKYS